MLLDPGKSRKVGAQAFVYASVFAGAAAVMWLGGIVQRSGLASTADVSASRCVENGQKFGVMGTKDDGKITYTWSDLKDGPHIMGVSSSIAMSCPGWHVDHYCIGDGCSNKGAEMVLKPNS